MKEKIARFLYSETDINNNKCYLSLWYIEKGKLVLAFGRYILTNGFCMRQQDLHSDVSFNKPCGF